MARTIRTINSDLRSKLPLCVGCRNDFYNQAGNSTSGQCWCLDAAKVVTRYRTGWWDDPTKPGAFVKVTTLDCHHAPGQYALRLNLPVYCPGRGDIEAAAPVDARTK